MHRIYYLMLGLLLLGLSSAGHARVVTTSSSSYGELIDLILSIPILPDVTVGSGPLPTSSGTAPGAYSDADQIASVSVTSGLAVNIGTGVIDTTAASNVDGSIGSKTTSATATVNDLGINLLASVLGLAADEVSSNASISGDFGGLTASGNAALANANLTTLGLPTVGLAVNPAPNTVVDVAGLLGLTGVTLTLNEQIVTGAGTNSQSVETNAIHLKLEDFASVVGLGLNTLNGDIIISHSEVEATAFRDANPVIQNAPVDFGNVRINTTATQDLSILNDVPNDGQSEELNASAGATTAGVAASGSFDRLAADAVNNTSIQVGLDTSVAGAHSGTATIDFETDGTNVAGNGLGAAALPSQDVQVSGDVYRLSNPVLNTPTISLAARTGDSSPSAAVSLTNDSPDQYTEGLTASPDTPAPTGFTASGSIANLAAQGTDDSSIEVSLDTTAAGTFGGNLALNLASTGEGTTGEADFDLDSQNVALSGKVYTPAEAQVNTPSVDFGIVHVGDTVSDQAISVTNAAAATALNDVLLGSVSATGAFTGSGDLGTGLAAQQTAASSLLVSLDTTTAGTFSGDADLSFQSHDPDLSDLSLPGTTVGLNAQVNNYVNAALRMNSGYGQLDHPSASEYVLDLGEMVLGSGAVMTYLDVLNDVLGPADLMDGTWDLAGAGDLTLGGFSDFFDITAGDMLTGLAIGYDPVSLGALDNSISLDIYGHNASGYRELEQTISFRIIGDVVNAQVPAPGTLALGVLSLVVLSRFRRTGKRAVPDDAS